MIRSYQGISPRVHESCYIDQSAQIIGDVEIAENCSVLHGMRYKYGVIMGDWVTVGHSVTLHGCTIGDRCLIGMGSVILNNARIGAGSIIAAGTVIPEGTVVEPQSLWMGVPGKLRKKLGEEEREMI